MRKLACIVMLLATASSQVAQQEKQASREAVDTILRITVNLVQVDAVVTDSRGRQVTDLKAEDFELLQDGKPQKITHFSYITNGRPRPAPAIISTPSRNAPPPPPMRLRPDQVRRTIALVVDDLGLSFESTVRARQALQKFVEEQMQPGDLVAILRTGAGMGALQQFTSDKRQLYAAIDRVRYNMMGRGRIGAFAPINDPADPSLIPPADSRGDIDEFRDEYFSIGTLGAINFVIRGLKEVPGRKAVVLISDSIRLFNKEGLNDRILDSVRRLTDLANRSSVVIYSVDARGLPALSLTAEDRVAGRNGPQIAEALMQRHADYFESQDGLNYLAQETGGLFLHDTNDIAGSIRSVLDDQSGYYLLGYTPDDATFQQLKSKEHPYHKIKVRVNRAGLHVRSRTGFFGVPDEDTKPVYKTTTEQLAAAMASPFGSGAVHLRLTGLFAANPKEGSFVQSLLYIDGRDLTFTGEPDDWHKAIVDILLITFGDNGQQVDESSRTYTIRLHGETYKSALDHGFVYTVNHPVKKPGAYQLRAAVRDSGTAKVGSASQFIEVPDVQKGRLLLSGIVVKASRPAATPAAQPEQPTLQQQEQAAADADALGSPAVRIFHAGKRLEYAVQIINAQEDHSTHQPQLESQLLLFHDGKQIFAGKPTLMQPMIAGEQAQKRVVSAGELQLGSRMELGEYTMQLVVRDKLAKEKFQTAAQWIDFEVVK